jgi:hypothetical protein
MSIKKKNKNRSLFQFFKYIYHSYFIKEKKQIKSILIRCQFFFHKLSAKWNLIKKKKRENITRTARN